MFEIVTIKSNNNQFKSMEEIEQFYLNIFGLRPRQFALVVYVKPGSVQNSINNLKEKIRQFNEQKRTYNILVRDAQFLKPEEMAIFNDLVKDQSKIIFWKEA